MLMLLVFGAVVFVAALIGAAVLAGAMLWRFGPMLARGLGVLLVLANAYRLMLAPVLPWVLWPAARWLVVGVLLWLFGHWLHMYRFRRPRSPLAFRVFSLPGLRALVPAAPAV